MISVQIQNKEISKLNETGEKAINKSMTVMFNWKLANAYKLDTIYGFYSKNKKCSIVRELLYILAFCILKISMQRNMKALCNDAWISLWEDL